MTDLSLFFGSFHALVVHLPIGVLIAAVLLHAASYTRKGSGLVGAVPWLYVLAAVGGLLAVASGWALAGPLAGPLGEASWDTHRFFGLGALGLTIVAAAAVSLRGVRNYLGLVTAVGAIAVTGTAGHLGGALVHGKGHFGQYAPPGVRKVLSPSGESSVGFAAARVAVADPDSVPVYTTVIAPMLEAACVDCHRAGFAQGGLRLDSYAALLGGGREGGGISLASEVWRRVTLPPEHPRYMPSRGSGLSYDQTLLLRAFMSAGPDSLAMVGEWSDHLGEEEYAAVERLYGLNVRPLPYVDRVRPADVEFPAGSDWWSFGPISQSHTLIEAVLRDGDAELDRALAELTAVADNVTWLDLGGAGNGSAWVRSLPAMPHLTELDLSGTDVGDEALVGLSSFPNLIKLTLVNTKVTDEGLATLAEHPSLERLYLYGTPTTASGADELAEARGPAFEVVTSLGF